MLYDMHAHIGSERERAVRKEAGIVTLLCATCPPEAEQLRALVEGEELLLPTYGLHPWRTDAYRAEDMLPYFGQGVCVGEIGLCSAWCSVPLDVQQRAFELQLDAAASTGKPVILHTKGEEARIARIIRPYRLPFIVHWYSCPEHLDAYLEQDCYFTVGPDVERNAAVQALALRAPLSRLLIETDGFQAVLWAEGAETGEERMLPRVLARTIRAIARLRKAEEAEIRAAIAANSALLIGRGRGCAPV